MESSVEQRLTFLEARVKTLEGLLQAQDVPQPAAPVVPPLPAEPEPEPQMWPPASEWRSPEPKPPIDLEELLGGRVLGWVGGVAVAIAAIFFVVMAVRNGWIGEAARMELAFAASTALTAFGVWLYDRRGQTQAALATVAAGIAALFASTAATTLHYHLDIARARSRDRGPRRRIRARSRPCAGTPRRSPGSGSSARCWHRCSSAAERARARSSS